MGDGPVLVHTIAIIFIPPGHPHDGVLVLACMEHLVRRAYEFCTILRDWDAVTAHLAAGTAQVVILATRTHRAGEAGRVEVVDEEETRIMRQRNAAIGRHHVAAPLTESAVHRIIYNGAPAPVGMDPESIAAARRIARHFDNHGCA